MAYDEDGQRHLHSTGCTTRTQALEEMARRYSTNSLLKGYSQQTPPSFGDYAESWWTDDCEYLKAEKDSGRELTKGYISIQRGSLERYLLPAFGKKKLEAIKVPIIEKWQRSLLDGTAPVKIPEKAVGKSSRQKPLSPKYVNSLTSLLSTMLQEAKRQGYIEKNPCKDLRGLSDRSKIRGMITATEAKKIFSSKAWYSDIARVASLLAAVTGMRSGEILAIRYEDVNVFGQAFFPRMIVKNSLFRSSRSSPPINRQASPFSLS